ncbi:Regulation of nuclear pre-mRNA domain-containing protein 2-like [Oopsacas minuta]|uniref:Regulation of nuclear pre-mRNA domain-containing protein 2-like n=1 Tax=Oopsacas minuta TaxID=111878 RepID=A0AAV7JV58_9METZ|nr:Regulation of nuclear pre-mRNA domain-containing protein 2-like [Oopsacas minuta]
MSSFNKKSLQDKLHRLNSSQESIETLSHWIIHHKQYAEDSVRIWKESFKESDPEKRLLLFYLANDVLQNSRRKGVPIFHSALKPHLLDASLFASGQKIQTSIERIFKIWKERKVYDKRFIEELKKRITMGPHTVIIKLPSAENLPIRDVPDFKASTLCDALDDMQKFESDLHVKASVMSKLRLDVADTRSLSLLKGRFWKYLNNYINLSNHC